MGLSPQNPMANDDARTRTSLVCLSVDQNSTDFLLSRNFRVLVTLFKSYMRKIVLLFQL